MPIFEKDLTDRCKRRPTILVCTRICSRWFSFRICHTEPGILWYRYKDTHRHNNAFSPHRMHEQLPIAIDNMGGSRGPLIFGKVNFIFYIVYNVWKNIFEIKFVFYSGRNTRSFWKCGGVGYACVWIEIVAATAFCSAKAPFWMISEAILIQKIYARLQKIASNFSKFSGEAPRRRSRLPLGSGLRPLPPPFPKFLDPPLDDTAAWWVCSESVCHMPAPCQVGCKRIEVLL